MTAVGDVLPATRLPAGPHTLRVLPERPGRRRLPLPALLAGIAAAQRAVSEADAADVLSVLCREARPLLAADTVAVGTREGNELAARAIDGTLLPGSGIPVEGTLAGLAVRSGRPQLCTDGASDARTSAERNRQLRIGSSVVVPILRGGDVLGVMSAFSPEPHAFDETDVAVLELLAGTTSTRMAAGLVAVEHAEVRHALADSQRRLMSAQELTGLAWWEWVVGSGKLHWSAGMHRLVGLDPAAGVPTIDEWLALVHPDDRSPAAELEQRAIREGEGYRLLFRVVLADGTIRHLQSWVSAVRGTDAADGAVTMLRGATLDVTAREEAAQAVAASERRFRVAFDNAPIGMMLISLDPAAFGVLLRGNGVYCRMLGYAESELLGRPVTDWTHPADRAENALLLARIARGEVDTLAFEKRYVSRDGSVVHAWVSGALAADPDGGSPYLIGHAIDVTDQRQAQHELERLALSDTLTGLANRSHLGHQLGQALTTLGAHGRGETGSGAARGAHVALLLLDLDRFKLVNDSLGHQTGDALLVEVAGRLRSVTREGTTIARLGGDEFVVLLDDLSSPQEALGIARRIVAMLREPYVLPSGETLVSTASVGIAFASGPGRSAEDLYREADLALYRAKDAGRDRYAVFDDDLRAAAVSRLDMEHRLRRALEHDGLRAVFQPVVNLRSGATVAMEALARIEDPQLGTLSPGSFVRVAEDTGLITSLDAWLTEHVVAAVATRRGRRSADGDEPPVAVNVSVRTLEQVDYVDRLSAALSRHDVPGSRLLVEITESTLLDSTPTVTASLQRLAELGVRVGIDDFGTGYSALAYLQQLNLDFLKIDRSFVTRLGRSARDDAVVAAVVDLAHAHNLTVTAEGVETRAQAEALRAMGCDRGQGWLFGRPAPWPATV